MSDLMDTITHEYDVFIIHASGDDAIASTICRALEAAPYKFRCLEQGNVEAFRAGRPVFHSIVEYISKARVTLLILTKDSFSKGWVSLETILALEHSVVRKELTLRILLYNVDVNSIDFLKKGLLECVPDISVDLNKENWTDLLVSRIKDKIALPDILPVGCLAHGQVFSHFVGYYVYLLPELENKLKEMDVYKQHSDKFCTKLITLLPGSCDVPTGLAETNSQTGIEISSVDELEFNANHAGKKRKMSIRIYKVERGNEEYYFVADVPYVIKAMHQIHERGLAKVELRFQLARFYYTLNEVLNHGSNTVSVMDKAVLVPYNDTVEERTSVIFDEVKNQIDLARQQQEHMDVDIPTYGRTAQRFLSENSSYAYDFYILVDDDEEKDKQYANEITKYLVDHGKTAAVEDETEHGILDKARWIITIISKESIKSKGLNFQCLSVLVDSINTNMLRALPVLVDVEPKDLPQLLKWVTLVSVKDSKFKERLLQTMNGIPIKIEERLPAGDVATGLAWAYVLNYLHIPLFTKTQCGLDENCQCYELRNEIGVLEMDIFRVKLKLFNFTGRIEKLLQEKNLSCGCVSKVFFLVPKSCEAKQSIVEEANKGFDSGSGPVETVGQLKEVVLPNGREYRFYMYKYTDPQNGKSVCFLSEYCTPINCMHAMATHFQFAGLNKAEMYRQAEDFVQLFDSIITREAVKHHLGDMTNMVKLIYFDDENSNLLSALQEHFRLNQVHNNLAGLVFAPRQDMMELD